jgi:hypothetical protein
MLATQGIVHFGEAAVLPLIEGARTGHWSQTGGVLLGLQILLEGFPLRPYNIPPTSLSSASREQIVRLARDLFRPGAMRWPHRPARCGGRTCQRSQVLPSRPATTCCVSKSKPLPATLAYS